MIKAKQMAGKVAAGSGNLVTQMWFERAQKVISSVDHIGKILEFCDYEA